VLEIGWRFVSATTDLPTDVFAVGSPHAFTDLEP
jgi:hypothetical protein